MIRISVTTAITDHPDSYLKQLVQLGADCLDFGNGASFAGVKEQGYPDLDALAEAKAQAPLLRARYQPCDAARSVGEIHAQSPGIGEGAGQYRERHEGLRRSGHPDRKAAVCRGYVRSPDDPI
ncbi:hypothetical protein LJK87_10335 [Paenibacillus sp. P25]|nr:hypothetical protein LJK87_10335 [Paenibacillus sp. P25]